MKTWKDRYFEKDREYKKLLMRIRNIKSFYLVEEQLNNMNKFINEVVPDLLDGLKIINQIELDYRIKNTDSTDKSVIEIISEQLLEKLKGL